MRFIKSFITARLQARAFAFAVALGLVVIPVSSALAYFLASGTGTVTGATITSSSPATITISAQYGDPANEFVYSGPSTTALAPGGTVRFGLVATCTASCPASVGSIHLASVSSNQSGCDSTSLPDTFSAAPLSVGTTIDTTPTYVGQMTVAMASDPTRSEVACLGATLSFHVATP